MPNEKEPNQKTPAQAKKKPKTQAKSKLKEPKKAPRPDIVFQVNDRFVDLETLARALDIPESQEIEYFAVAAGVKDGWLITSAAYENGKEDAECMSIDFESDDMNEEPVPVVEVWQDTDDGSLLALLCRRRQSYLDTSELAADEFVAWAPIDTRPQQEFLQNTVIPVITVAGNANSPVGFVQNPPYTMDLTGQIVDSMLTPEVLSDEHYEFSMKELEQLQQFLRKHKVDTECFGFLHYAPFWVRNHIKGKEAQEAAMAVFALFGAQCDCEVLDIVIPSLIERLRDKEAKEAEETKKND